MVPKLELQTEQKLVITPMLQQALKVLQVPTLELARMVRQELAENPMLVEKEQEEPELTGPATEIPEPPSQTEEKTQEVVADEGGLGPEGGSDEEWERLFPDDDYIMPSFNREQIGEYTEPQIAQQPTLSEHLLWQLRLVCESEAEYHIGELIIGNLDEHGFFTVPLSEIAQEAQTDEDTVADVLGVVQELEPLGIAARDVKESLLIQLRHLPERHPLAEAIVEKHFSLLERRQLDVIARTEKVPRRDVVEAERLIKTLDPYPGRHQTSGHVEYVVPDAVVEKHDDQYIIIINDDNLPELGISRRYQRILRRKVGLTADERKFLKEQQQRARMFMESIVQRRKTLRRVVETIIEYQKDFFERGVEHLRPLTLKTIADHVNLHESTISRVTSSKYIQTPRGLFKLKYFFSSHIKTADGGTISSTSVKAALQDLVAQEDRRRPLSDQRLVKLLQGQGFELARRTVAKYREELNVPPASRRKIIE